jgi:hypothetical protein
MPVIDIPAYALGDQELWTPKLVKEALVEAFLTIERTTAKTGPRRAAQQLWHGLHPDEVALLRMLNDDQLRFLRKGQPQRPPRITSGDISRAEGVVFGSGDNPPWLSFIADDPARPKLVLWLQHEMGKEMGIKQRALRERCEMLRWAPRSFFRHVDSAAGAISHQLNLAGILVW